MTDDDVEDDNDKAAENILMAKTMRFIMVDRKKNAEHMKIWSCSEVLEKGKGYCECMFGLH